MENDDTYGLGVRQNFHQILAKAKAQRPDLLVIPADLCYRDGDARIYAWIKHHLDESGLPYEVMSGNHDDPVLLARAFGREGLLKGKELYFSREYADRTVLFLDTTTYEMPAKQMEWLSEDL